MSYSHQEFQLIKKKIADLSNSNPNWKAMGWQYKYTNGERPGDVGITLIVEKKLPLNEIKDKDIFMLDDCSNLDAADNLYNFIEDEITEKT